MFFWREKKIEKINMASGRLSTKLEQNTYGRYLMNNEPVLGKLIRFDVGGLLGLYLLVEYLHAQADPFNFNHW